MPNHNNNNINYLIHFLKRKKKKKIYIYIYIYELTEDEKTKKTYLAIIGSAFDLRRQTFVLATREMVALQNRSLPQHTSSSHLHHLLRLLRYLRHRTNSLTSLPIANPNAQLFTTLLFSFLSPLSHTQQHLLHLQLIFSLYLPRISNYLSHSFLLTTNSISETNTNNVKDVNE